jgi:RNA polymerase sigma factor (sigma-70 family)
MLSPSSTPRIDPELKALRAGEISAACRTIVTRYGPLVKAACLRVLRDEGLAEDAAQETFVLLVRKARSLSPEISLAGWLYHAAYRTALNHRRAALRRRLRETSAAALHSIAHAPQPNLWAEIEPHLDEAMASLSERQRTLVVQCYFQNQSQRSAAAALGCSESLVSRELNSAIETLRRFFAKRRVLVSSAALTGALPANASSAILAGSAKIATAMTASAVTASTLTAALIQSKLLLATAALAGTATVALVGYRVAPPSAGGQQIVNAEDRTTQADAAKAPAAGRGGVASQGNGKASFQFTNEMAFVEKKKAVLLEADPELRYALLQAMGLRLSRAGFDSLIAQGMDASVAPWRNTFDVLANRTEAFDHYVMAWSNEDPLGALNWVTSQPDGALGMRKQLLYVLTTKQFTPDALSTWITGLPTASMKHEATLALEAMRNPSAPIAHMGTGDNEGFLVDLALLHGERLDWSAFGRKLAVGKRTIVARVMRNVVDNGVSSPQHLDALIQGLAHSPDAHIRVGAVTMSVPCLMSRMLPDVRRRNTALLLTCGKKVVCGCQVLPPSVEKLWSISFMQRESIQSVPSSFSTTECSLKQLSVKMLPPRYRQLAPSSSETNTSAPRTASSSR